MPASRNAITRKLRRRKSPKGPRTATPRTGGLSRQQRRRRRLRQHKAGVKAGAPTLVSAVNTHPGTVPDVLAATHRHWYGPPYADMEGN